MLYETLLFVYAARESWEQEEKSESDLWKEEIRSRVIVNFTFFWSSRRAKKKMIFSLSDELGDVQVWLYLADFIIKVDKICERFKCRDYHNMGNLNSTWICNFMKTTENCQIDDGFVNYLVFTYCNFELDLTWLAILLLVIQVSIHSRWLWNRISISFAFS